MNIVVTVDAECYSGDYSREVYARGLGLPFILDCLQQHRVHATFFVEVLGATRWGIAETHRMCRVISGAGQEIQLHLHPSVATLDGFVDRDDVLWNQDVATQERLIRAGLDVLMQCGVKASAFRAGDLAASEDTLAAMKQVGLSISSNRDMDIRQWGF